MDELVAPPDLSCIVSSTPRSSSSRDRGDQLLSGAQSFFAVYFDWHIASKHDMSPFKVEQMVFLKLHKTVLW